MPVVIDELVVTAQPEREGAASGPVPYAREPHAARERRERPERLRAEVAAAARHAARRAARVHAD